MNNYDERLRAEIERIGVSKLAKELGIARNTLYNWCEKANVPLDKLMALAQYGLDVVFVLTGNRSEGSLDVEEQELINGFRSLDTSTRKRVLAFVDNDDLPSKVTKATGSVVNQSQSINNGIQIGHNSGSVKSHK